MSAFALEDVTVAFGPRRALERVSLRCEPGQIVALIGGSGAGKSTLLELLAGLRAVDQGVVEVGGVALKDMDATTHRKLRRDVGFMAQQHNLVEGLRVLHNVAMGRLGERSGWRALWDLVWPGKALVDSVRDVLGTVELADRIWDWPEQLSGGERQRVALARLLLQSPRLWLADEPAAGLDPRLRRALLRRLIALAREHEAGCVVSLHELSLLDEGFDRVVAMRAGRIVLDGESSELDRGALAEVFEA